MELQAGLIGDPETARRLVLLVHGYGATEQDLAPLAQLLGDDLLGLCPRGPIDVPGAGASWYHFTQDGPDRDTFCGSLVALDHLVDAVCADTGLDRREAVFGGFSQGGSMVLALALRASTKARPAAVLSMSGFLARPDWLTYGWDDPAPANGATWPPVLVQHGRQDPMVGFDRAEEAARVLESHGLPARFEAYDMAHEVTPDSLAAARSWLAGVLG